MITPGVFIHCLRADVQACEAFTLAGFRRRSRMHEGDRDAAPHLNSKADITKFSISTSSEALTTARVVATEVPSMVGSAW